MHKFVFAIAAGASLLASASVYADGAKTKIAVATSFAALDRNRDDRISRSEAGFDHVLSRTFAEIDTDGDGFVSPAEFAAAEKTSATVNNVTR
jgi:hypothetical protein